MAHGTGVGCLVRTFLRCWLAYAVSISDQIDAYAYPRFNRSRFHVAHCNVAWFLPLHTLISPPSAAVVMFSVEQRPTSLVYRSRGARAHYSPTFSLFTLGCPVAPFYPVNRARKHHRIA